MIPDVTDLIDDLQWRGLIAQSTDLTALRAALAGGSLMLYAGFDPTAGNLVPLLTLRRFSKRDTPRSCSPGEPPV